MTDKKVNKKVSNSPTNHRELMMKKDQIRNTYIYFLPDKKEHFIVGSTKYLIFDFFFCVVKILFLFCIQKILNMD